MSHSEHKDMEAESLLLIGLTKGITQLKGPHCIIEEQTWL